MLYFITLAPLVICVIALHRYKDKLVNALKEMVTVYFDNRMKPTKIFCGQNAELRIVKADGV
jgi:hypothetical protein